jgi:uncharacterized membrane protein
MLAYAIVPWSAYAALYALYLAGYRPFALGMAGVALCIVGPGFALIPALFGGQASFDAAESLALAAPLSLAVGGIVGVVLTYSPHGLQLETYLGALFVFTSISLVISILRRNQRAMLKAPTNRVPPTGNPEVWKQHHTLNASLNLGLTVMMLFGAAALAYNMQRPVLGPYFTEFYLLNTSDQLGNYPNSLSRPEPVVVRYGIANREARDATYQVCIVAKEQLLSCADPIVLQPDESWEGPISLDITGVIDKPAQIEFVLLRAQEIYRTLHLWVYPDR